MGLFVIVQFVYRRYNILYLYLLSVFVKKIIELYSPFKIKQPLFPICIWQNYIIIFFKSLVCLGEGKKDGTVSDRTDGRKRGEEEEASGSKSLGQKER